MRILRLSTVSLALAIALFALSYIPSFANKPTDGKHDHGDEPSSPSSIEIELIGGAFAFDNGVFPPTRIAVAVTAESEGTVLAGDESVHMTRPGPAVNMNCLSGDDQALCMDWNSVFNLCNLLGPPMDVQVDEFTVDAGRKGWKVAKVVDDISIGLGFEVFPPFEISTSPLKVGLQLFGDCPNLDCVLVPTEAPVEGSPLTLEIPLHSYSIHLRGKGGVTHAAECHAASNVTLDLGTLRITAPAP